ncbi:dolichyl pyrophosphate Man9GlcNAc2 alpha-1,3-glucosyltransferase isoform X1 [Patella vulgata]|uniref:dolichyl pyrophosphate Man9GlcNAc2 alpha-1,3-glucosyltransferase isoform X1 n=2 Tax=Patella vulgata TaxID=6465 RepID=UPI0021809448|nr:dolichyl pyrophosphate Man9GlcNAc2 alpha-1,3-glucosyltransferase isoform X1 [Patella vulgata]
MGLLVEVCVLVVISIALRWSVSQNTYSGQSKPPMYGDYEAQRHWMEITLNLPVSDWYRNTTNNDLQYWGLDYPPLTAYHSKICGYVAQYINPDWVRLYKSRGYESYYHKLFMRYTVLVADFLIFLPAAVLFYLAQDQLDDKSMLFGLMVILLYPGLILIDYGHFQYNGISLGLAVLAVACLGSELQMIGAALFTLALNYKQMELYHAMPFFTYLLGKCYKAGPFKGLFEIIKIGITVIITFLLCWSPFLTSVESAKQVLTRLFPFNRGLYEDKVASFWCSLSVLIKLKNILSQENLVLLCLSTTLLCLLPSSLHLLCKPTITNFKYALVNSSLVFFLFSFQVHEKSILIPAISVCMLANREPLTSIWFLSISTFSMLPLLVKDGLILPYIGLSAMFLIASVYISQPFNNQKPDSLSQLKKINFIISMVGVILLTGASHFIIPPPQLPDLFPVLISSYSCAHFLFFLLYFHFAQIFGDEIDIDRKKSTRVQTSKKKKSIKKEN